MRAGRGVAFTTPSTPPGTRTVGSTPHSPNHASGSSAVDAPVPARNMATSNPMPPAPTIATVSPTSAPCIRTSTYESTFGWSAPANPARRGVTPVADDLVVAAGDELIGGRSNPETQRDAP